jgi:hypothetical protein
MTIFISMALGIFVRVLSHQQKSFVRPWLWPLETPEAQIKKSLLLLFFRKEALPS